MKTLVRMFAKFWIWASKIIPDLWLLDLFWPIKKKFHTLPYYTVTYMVYLASEFSIGREAKNNLNLWTSVVDPDPDLYWIRIQ